APQLGQRTPGAAGAHPGPAGHRDPSGTGAATGGTAAARSARLRRYGPNRRQDSKARAPHGGTRARAEDRPCRAGISASAAATPRRYRSRAASAAKAEAHAAADDPPARDGTAAEGAVRLAGARRGGHPRQLSRTAEGPDPASHEPAAAVADRRAARRHL